MRLSKKTFCYSILISLILVIFIVLYFSFMLPSLYVSEMEKDNLASVVSLQEGYLKNRSYDGMVVKNPTGAATLEIPLQGNQLYVVGKAFKVELTVKSGKILEYLEAFREAILVAEDSEDVAFPKPDWEALKEELIPDGEDSYPISMILNASEDMEGVTTTKGRTHVISDSILVFEGGMTDGENQYTTYVASSKISDALIFSFMPVTTPQMKEIRPIVLGSLPMITMVVLVLVLIGSQMFSRKIVEPVICLANYAQEVKNARMRDIPPFEIKGKDEIAELGNALNELYARLRHQYQELERKNQKLAGENKRQEVFLRASSHQLKTPITAAILLVDGMMGEIGKYKDTKKYLPQVKKQLKSMQKVVEDILYLNHCTEHIEMEPVDMGILLEEVVDAYKVQAEEKRITFVGNGVQWQTVTDRELLKKIIDNLISNAVAYTASGERIEIRGEENRLTIRNYGAHIDEELLPHIYEPFVSSDTRQKGRGLGLYVTAYYADILGFDVKLMNLDDSVCASLAKKNPQEMHMVSSS